ncbi:hypothetical protein V5O48_013008 [Marasmius crinis-equi]|uniref:Uncharacterized protein n=1 Tax=Marasmius crinis-equi TaxID=585013 RepID=A0ABR3F1A9_9AGAR
MNNNTINPSLLHQQSPVNNELGGSLGLGTTSASTAPSSESNLPSSGGEGLQHLPFFDINNAMQLDLPGTAPQPTSNPSLNPTGANTTINSGLSGAKPPTYTQSLSVNISPGSWKAMPGLGLVMHFHDDQSPCLNLIEHACIALGLRNSGFLDARGDLVDEYQSELRKKETDERNEELESENDRLRRERNDTRKATERLQKRVDELEKASQSPPTSSPHPSTSGPKRKTPDVKATDTHMTPPSKRPATSKTATNVQMIIPNISFNIIDAAARTPAGAQTFPSSSEELNQLVTQSQTPESFDSMYRVVFLCWTASLLHYLHIKASAVVPSLSGVPHTCLTVPIEADWATYPIYILYHLFYRDDIDSPTHWANTPSNIPSLHNTPKPNVSRIEWAEAMFVHYDPRRHLGVHMGIIRNTGFVYMPTVNAFMLYYALSPLVPTSDKSSVPEYRTNLITLLAIPGLYREIITKNAINIAPTRYLSRSTRDVVKTDRYNVWAIQYCLDVSRNTTFPEHMRFKYAQIFVHAQNRLLFYPLPTPPSDTYQVPDHWDIAQITEYRRHSAVLNHWKNTSDHPKLPSKDYKLPKLTYAPHNLPDATVNGLAQMNIDTEGAGPLNQSTQRLT